MEEKEIRLLRFFAEDKEARRNAVQEFVQGGVLDTAVREKNGETLLLLTSRLESKNAGLVLLNHCQEREELACGDALYGTGNTTLFEAMVDAQREKGMLFVAADAATCEMLNEPLEKLPRAGGVYDFGGCSCHQSRWLKRVMAAGAKESFPLAAAQERIQTACCLTAADWAVSCFTEEDSVTVVVGNERGSWVCALPPERRPVLWAADILRRAAIGGRQAPNVLWVRADSARRSLPDDPQTIRRRMRQTLGLSFAGMLAAAGLCWGLFSFFTGGQLAKLWM